MENGEREEKNVYTPFESPRNTPSIPLRQPFLVATNTTMKYGSGNTDPYS